MKRTMKLMMMKRMMQNRMNVGAKLKRALSSVLSRCGRQRFEGELQGR